MTSDYPTNDYTTARRLLRLLFPPAVLLIVLLTAWRLDNPFTTVVAYGDSLEALWAIDWLREALGRADGQALFVPGVFMPEGWRLITLAHGMGLFALAVPLAALTNTPFALNLVLLAGFFIAFFGTYRLARLMTGELYAVVAAVLYVTWGGRWLRLEGMPGLWLGTALLPWLLLALEMSLRPGRRAWLWLLIAGLIWAAAISLSLYFLWLGAVMVGAWLLGMFLSGRLRAGALLRGLLVPAAVALTLTMPYLLAFRRANEAANAAPFTIFSLRNDAASLDWLAAPFAGHWLRPVQELALSWTDGIVTEASLIGFGVVLPVVALAGLFLAWRRVPQWGSLVLLAGAGLLLALGPALQWNGRPVEAPGLDGLNQALWSIGHAVKPVMFPGESVPAGFAHTVPLPGLLPAIFVPFFEGARVMARYTFVAAPAVVLLAAMALEQMRRPLLRSVVAALLLLSVLRTPLSGVPFPPPSHPAFDWLAARPVDLVGEGSILEVWSPENNVFIPALGGEALWATRYHAQPIAHGGGSVLPGHTAYLREWLALNSTPLRGEELAWLLNGYGVRLLLVYIQRDTDRPFLESAVEAGFALEDCFEPAAAQPPWPHPICVLRVPEMAASPSFNVRPVASWSGAEPWGRWAETTEARVQWVATDGEGATLAVEAFPYCEPGGPQQVEFVVGEQVVGSHRWDNCDAWQGLVVVPPELEVIGWNEMTLRFLRADRPADVTAGVNPDSRELAVGFSRFELLDE